VKGSVLNPPKIMNPKGGDTVWAEYEGGRIQNIEPIML